MIRAFTKRDVIRDVPFRWRQQYPDQHYPPGDEKYAIGDHLDALDVETATEDDIAKVIGNTTWTNMSCDACDQSVDALVTVGQIPDYESRTANLCLDCARVAFEEIVEATQP